jgi:hypothetical protein
MKLHYIEAAGSALVVGLGQIIKGQTEKGLVLLLVFYFVLPAVIYGTLLINGYLFLSALGIATISGIILWIYSIADALLRK